MITQIKKIGGSLVIIIPTIFKDYMKLNEGDYIDIYDIVKKNKKDVLKSIDKQTMKEIKNITDGVKK